MSINRQAMKALPIQGYLDYQGIAYTVEHNRLRLVEHDSCLINLDKNIFYWNSRHLSGDLGNFIAAYDNVSLKEAWIKWTAYARYYNQQDTQTKSKYQADAQPSAYHFDWSKWRTAQTTTNSEHYLVHERGFDAQFIHQLAQAGFIKQGMAYQDSKTKTWQKPALLFPWFDDQRQVVGLDQQGTSVDFEKYGKRGTQKKIASGSQTKYGYNFRTGNGADRLIVFESPIDALSYAQMNFSQLANTNTTFLSISGVDHQKVLAQLDRMNVNNGHLPKHLVLATDNDLAGYQVADKFDVLRFEGVENIREVPVKGKDWNEQLQAGVTGIKPLSMSENKQRLTALEQFKVNQTSSGHSKQAVKPTESKDVVSPKPTSKATSQHPSSRQERQTQTRLKNQQVIKDALTQVANYQNDPVAVQRYLDFVAQGQNYSPRNTQLIYGQRQDATIVMGYKQFAERGIQVNKGEKGLKIFGAPVNLRSIITAENERVYWRDATPAQRQAAKAGDLEVRSVQHYPIETVFDVKQTNAKLDDLPQLLPNRPVNLATDQSPDQLEKVYQTLKNYAANEQHARVVDQDGGAIQFLADHQPMTSQGIAKGATIINRQKPDNVMIVLRPDLPVTDRIATLAHEVGHVALHQNMDQPLSSGVKELEAEMTSYVILKNVGIEPGVISEKYMSDWTNHLQRVPQLNKQDDQFLNRVTKASTNVTDYLSHHLSNGKPQALTQRVSQQNKVTQTALQQVLQDQAQEKTNVIEAGRSHS